MSAQQRSSKSNSTKANAVQHVSLVDFMRNKAREGCPICKLPPEIRAQLGRGATRRGFTREDQVEWLRVVCGATDVTIEVLASHVSARHDREEDFHAAP